MYTSESALAEQTRTLLLAALQEDVGLGDLTSQWTIEPWQRASGSLVARQSGLVAGLSLVTQLCQLADPDMVVECLVPEPAQVSADMALAHIHGRTRALLMIERTALNLLQRLSGIACRTQQFAEQIQHTSCVLLDTRKTLPGWRQLDKQAVVWGGGVNHRTGLHDFILIKENHIRSCGSVSQAIWRAHQCNRQGLTIEVEVTNLHECREALAADPDRILLDNMDLEQIRACVRLNGGRIPLEVSGNVSLGNIRALAETGVDFISVGSLTHSAPAFDISFYLREVEHAD